MKLAEPALKWSLLAGRRQLIADVYLKEFA